jgi:alkylation response protein AidB-like acyl-CoA dehydrogenase
MDFRDDPAQAAFRARAAAFLDEALADIPDQSTLNQAEREHWSRVWHQRLAEGGWVGLTLPPEYGGHGLDVVYQAIFNEEAARRHAPYPLGGAGMIMTAPTIVRHGTEAQKRRYIPPILRGDEIWCQGFSEPDSGSDLASLRTSARRVDGGWLIRGQKVWTSYAHVADRCMLLARTDPDAPKHRGITYFLVDMAQVQVRPLVMTNGDAEFNEMFLDDVFVSDDDVLGEVNGGWEVALTTLAYERGGLALNLWVWAHQAVDALIAVVRSRGLVDQVATEVGELYAAAEAVRIGSIRAMADVSAGRPPGPATSALKLQWARVVQDATRLAVRLSAHGGVGVDEPDAAYRLHRYLRARAHSIEGGTDEVQKSIIAERALGLPRSR